VAVALRQAESLRKQLQAARDKAKSDAASFLDALGAAIDRAAGPPRSDSGEEFFEAVEAPPSSLRRIAASLADLQSVVESADAPPTADALAAFGDRRKLADLGLARWQELLAQDVPQAGKVLKAAGLPPLTSE
jgi:hypothetical protein